jgi:hypothetical protein
MYRKPGSNMTAVEVVSAMYDGYIPADVMMQARAEDARFAAVNPNRHPAPPTAIEEAQMMVSYYKDKVHRMIAAKRTADATGIINSAWRASELCSWFRAWRAERRRLKTLLANFHSAA